MANDYAALVPEVWAQEVLLARNEMQVIAPTVTTPLESEISEGDTVHFPVWTNFTVGDAADNGTENTTSARNFTTIDLAINKHKFAAAHYTKKELKQIAKSARYEQNEQKQMGTDLMLQIETDLYNEMTGAALTTLGSQGGGLTDAVMRSIVKFFDDAKTPETDRFLLLSSKGKSDLLGIDKFTKINEGGRIAEALLNFSQVKRNFLAEIYGINVLWTTIVGLNAGSPAGYTCVAYTGNSIGLALQQTVDVNMEYRTLKIGQDVLADTLYGVKALRPAEIAKVLI